MPNVNTQVIGISRFFQFFRFFSDGGLKPDKVLIIGIFAHLWRWFRCRQPPSALSFVTSLLISTCAQIALQPSKSPASETSALAPVGQDSAPRSPRLTPDFGKQQNQHRGRFGYYGSVFAGPGPRTQRIWTEQLCKKRGPQRNTGPE